MNSKEEAEYRLKLARGYLEEAERFYEHKFWRACVSSSQLGVENAAKAVISLYRPIVKEHDLVEHILRLIDDGEIEKTSGERLANYLKILGLKEHILTDYGDELAYKTPWEIYSEKHAANAIGILRDVLKIAEGMVGRV